MTAIAFSKARGRRWPVRHDEALEGLSDAGQWVLDTLRAWRRPSRERRFLERMRRDVSATRADAIDLSNNRFWKE